MQPPSSTKRFKIRLAQTSKNKETVNNALLVKIMYVAYNMQRCMIIDKPILFLFKKYSVLHTIKRQMNQNQLIFRILNWNNQIIPPYTGIIRK